jgi:hypothetical protein
MQMMPPPLLRLKQNLRFPESLKLIQQLAKLCIPMEMLAVESLLA